MAHAAEKSTQGTKLEFCATSYPALPSWNECGVGEGSENRDSHALPGEACPAVMGLMGLGLGNSLE